MKQTRIGSAALAVVIATVAFISFGAGYMTRPSPVAGASSYPTPPTKDGNPVGFTLTEKATSVKPSGKPPSCLTTAATCNITVSHSTQAAFTCTSGYCAAYSGKVTLKLIWPHEPPSQHTYNTYSLISSP